MGLEGEMTAFQVVPNLKRSEYWKVQETYEDSPQVGS